MKLTLPVLCICAGEYVKYAHGLIADYLPADLSKQLATSLWFVCLSVCLSVCLLANRSRLYKDIMKASVSDIP